MYLHLLIILAGVCVASPNCDSFKDCSSCVSHSTWTGNHCRWCPKSSDCHAEGSIISNCDPQELISNVDRCPLPVEQIHIAFAGRNANGDVNGMTISWASPANTKLSIVHYGLSEDNLSMTASGSSSKYLEKATWHHHVTIQNLKPGQTYYYKCGDPDAGFSAINSFQSAKGSDPLFGGFKASVFGDWGYSKNGHAISTRNALQTIKEEVDFVWHVGDIGYADDAFLHDPLSFQYENVYDSYMQWISNITESKPYMVLPGNHEAECHSPACLVSSSLRDKLSNFTAYNTRFKMPYESSNGTSNMWYSFNYGLAHFVIIDSETDYIDAPEGKRGPVLPSGGFGKTGEQLEWLEADLIKANEERAHRPWIFVGGHRPVYSDTTHASLIHAFEDLFKKYNVDIYFSGHEHSYTRSFPVYRQAVENFGKDCYTSPNSTAYVVVGGAGCDEMTPEGPDGYDTSADWIVTHDHHFGTGILHVINASTVKWTYLQSDSLSVADEFWVTK